MVADVVIMALCATVARFPGGVTTGAIGFCDRPEIADPQRAIKVGERLMIGQRWVKLVAAAAILKMGLN